GVLFLTGRIKDPFHPMMWIGVIGFVTITLRLWRNWEGTVVLVGNEEILQRYLVVMAMSMVGMYLGWWHWGRKQLPRLLAEAAPAAREYDPARLVVAIVMLLMVALPIYVLYRSEGGAVVG